MSSLRERAMTAASDAERRSRQSPPPAEPSLEDSPAFIRVDEFLDEWFAAIGVARPSSARVKARMGEDESGLPYVKAHARWRLDGHDFQGGGSEYGEMNVAIHVHDGKRGNTHGGWNWYICNDLAALGEALEAESGKSRREVRRQQRRR